MRTPVVSGNLKMYKDRTGTTSFFESFQPLVERSGHCEIVICPSFLGLETAAAAGRETRIEIAAPSAFYTAGALNQTMRKH